MGFGTLTVKVGRITEGSMSKVLSKRQLTSTGRLSKEDIERMVQEAEKYKAKDEKP